mmetsp:Transcript_50779/g.84160  ORF Transcript_50779/g.84160 Transcript_50779/m.84160 type:complete len:211 (+) Transcript_50779:39-671(+)
MSTRPREGAKDKLSSSLDELIKGDRPSGSGPMRRRDRESRDNRDSRPYSRPRDDRDRNGSSDVTNSVYVGNLPWSLDWRTLKEHMRSAGDVVRADIAAGDDGRSRGYGIVEFSNAKGVRKAIATLHETELEGRQIIVREDRGGGAGIRPFMGGGVGGRDGPPRRGGGESDVDPVYSNSGITGRNGWVRPDPDSFVDEGPPQEPKGSILRD